MEADTTIEPAELNIQEILPPLFSDFEDAPLPDQNELLDAINQEDYSFEEDDEDEAILAIFESREQEYHELHDQIEASTELLTNLSSFLTSFQTDLQAVSGQLKDLRSRSQAIERRGKGRRSIEKPLKSLIESITFPPSLVTLILDTPVSEAWYPAAHTLSTILSEIHLRKTRVQAASSLLTTAETLRVTAVGKIKTYLLKILNPISASVSTNLPTLQTGVLLKNKPLWEFLEREAPAIAAEIKRSYVWRTRGYYETSFRRYCRVIQTLKTRCPDTSEPIGSLTSSSSLPTTHLNTSTSAVKPNGGNEQTDRELEGSLLANSRIEGEGVLLAWQADEKDLKLPLEALFRSIMVVLLDNACAEYTFLTRFFSRLSLYSTRPDTLATQDRLLNIQSEHATESGSGGAGRSVRKNSIISSVGAGGGLADGWKGSKEPEKEDKEDKERLQKMWHEIFDPALNYVQQLLTTLLTPLPPSLPSLLSMIRLNDSIFQALLDRGCIPLEPFVIRQRLALWPVFQKHMGTNVESLRKLAETAGLGASFLGLGATKVKDSKVESVAVQYVTLFNALLSLSTPADEAMIIGSMTRLRQELARLITSQAGKIKESGPREIFTFTIYDGLVQALRTSFGTGKAVTEEISFWEKARLGK
ncbi:Vacuolar sorting protein VPS52/suppressor of actin Sac2 [Phaffia rhodozyma]|uniref:Vacuolar sorting protein VPS52/suppressor of actin Sac2 n=1 Tax=Phaffia rhodozyma TaxID=264483 RepID=A0A0F7SWZ3_PHARH|nr:Vacuolar sorting protein VPS52/suppressor of actin Sac2 [Phaffia rhodozyma]